MNFMTRIGTEKTMERRKSKMKKTIAIMVLFSFVLFACGSNKPIPINTEQGVKTYVFKQYGLLNTDQKNPNVEYQIVIGNIICSVIFFETIVVPIVLLGFYLYEPIGLVNKNIPKG